MMDSSQSRKRPRPVVSCLRCREKKLKCDRSTPCENCTKASCPTGCAYANYPVISDPIPKAKRLQPSVDATEPSYPQRDGSVNVMGSVGVVEDLQSRVAKLEDLLSVKASALNSPRHARDASLVGDSSRSGHLTTQSIESRNVLGTLVVKGSRSRYHGQNDRITLLNQFGEVKDFINQAAQDPSIVELAKEVQFLQGKSLASIKTPNAVSDSDISPALQNLYESIPSKATCDRLLDIYTRHFEKSLRILHLPSFIREYTQFWPRRNNPDILKSSPFLPQLTAVLTLSLTLEDPNARIDDPDARRYLKTRSLDWIASWLDELGRKQRTELATLQIETLLLWAQRLRLMPIEKLWSSTGALVRSAMVMGLHQNPADSKLSFYQAECRRRLWITIVELDLQASIVSGMPVMAPEVDFAPLTPSNFNDSDFDEYTKEPPTARPLHEWTDCLAQVTLAMSLPQRIKVMALLKSATTEMGLDQVVKQGRRLEEFLEHVPPPLKLDHALVNRGGPACLLNGFLVDMYTRRSLLCLYRPLLLGESWDDPSFHEVQRVCLESSLVILSYQDYFDSYVADAEVNNIDSYWDMFRILCKNDMLMAALTVCQYMQSTSQQQSSAAHTPPNNLAIRQQPSPQNLQYNKANLTRVVQNTLDGLTRRIGDIGGDLKDIIFLSIVLQSVQARGRAQQKENLLYQGVRKALDACLQNLLPTVVPEAHMQSLKQSPALKLPEIMYHPSTHPMGPPSTQGHLSPNMQYSLLQQPEFIARSSTLATEFNNFQGDIFSYQNGAFDIDIDWNFDQFWR